MERCQACGNRLNVLNTRVRGDKRIRYLGCGKCGRRPEENKRVIPLGYAPPR